MSFSTVNPNSNQVLSCYSYHSDQEIEAKIAELNKGFEAWSVTQVSDRKNYLKSFAEELFRQKQGLAEQITLEMGKSLTDSLAEVDKCILAVNYYCQNAEVFLKTRIIKESSLKAQIHLAPLGIIFAIMPWNYPVWQFIRCAVPAFLIGNGVLLKHSEITAGVAEMITLIMKRALVNMGAKFSIVENLRLPHSATEKVICDHRIKAVSFTGSIRGGKQISELSGRHLKKCVMELGGSDPYLVLSDADLPVAVNCCAQSRLLNAGQSCISAKRFFVHEALYREFMQMMQKTFDQAKIAPLAHLRFKQQLAEQVNSLPGKVVYQAPQSLTTRAYYPPTIMEMSSQRTLWTEELFGPVACVWKFEHQDQAISAANHSIFGLGAAIFSKNSLQAQKIASSLNVGMVAINDYLKSDPSLPFGGVNQSGFGRELSYFGIQEFANIKTLVGV